MSDIDWSKANERAVAALVATQDNVHYPSIQFVSGYHRTGCMIRATSAEDGRSLSAPSECWALVDRPWSGKGLPPAGTTCEVGGEKVVVVAHHCNGTHAIYAESTTDGLLYYGEPNEFRPIRTPEQIAAEEREKAAKDMATLMTGHEDHKGEWGCYVILGEILYDAGYRKTEAT